MALKNPSVEPDDDDAPPLTLETWLPPGNGM